MKKVTALLICFAMIKLYGQTPASTGSNKLQIGVNFSSDYCYRTVVNNYDNPDNDWVIKHRNNTETPKFGYTTGVNLTYNLNKTIGFEIGLQFSNKGYQTETFNLTFGDQIDSPGGLTNIEDSELPTLAKIIYSYHHIDVPIKANFSFGKKKIRFITSAGIVTNFFINEITTGVFEYGDGSKKRNSTYGVMHFNTTNISPMISVGIDYKISPKLNLKAEPTFRYGALKISDTPITEYLWNYGVNLSCYYNI